MGWPEPDRGRLWSFLGYTVATRMGKQPEHSQDSQKDPSRWLQRKPSLTSLPPCPNPSQEENLTCPHPLLLLCKEAACSKQKNPSIIYTKCLLHRLLKSQGGSQAQSSLKRHKARQSLWAGRRWGNPRAAEGPVGPGQEASH